MFLNLNGGLGIVLVGALSFANMVLSEVIQQHRFLNVVDYTHTAESNGLLC